METIGFALAARAAELRWMVVRGISDHGTGSSRSDLNRKIAAGLAARVLAGFVTHVANTSSLFSAVSSLGHRHFLFDLDDPQARPFGMLTSSAERLVVLSRTAVNLLGGYRSEFMRLLNKGARVHLIMVDPRCLVASHLYGKNFAIYRNNLRNALQITVHLEEYARGKPGELVLRLIDDVPPFSMTMVEGPESIMRLQLNFLHTLVGRDRPTFELRQHDVWFSKFREECEAIWRDSVKISASELLNQLNGDS